MYKALREADRLIGLEWVVVIALDTGEGAQGTRPGCHRDRGAAGGATAQ
jgi:hypothetical protein